jgi:hypothetical protein
VASQIPSKEQFVVQVTPDNKRKVLRQLESIGSIEDLGEGDEFLLRVNKAGADARIEWLRLTKLIGSSGTVQSVLSDETGHPHFPTGELTVRFKSAPSNEELKRFAANYGLRLRDRNEFVPEQAAFRQVDSTRTFLPDLIEQISANKTVKQVWANTRSHYSRKQ